jgi:Mismatch repair ATPase (MutS family)
MEASMDLSYRIAAVVIIIILFLVIKGIYDEKRYKQRLYLRLKNSWGNPSRQEYPQQLMDAVKYYYNNNKGDNDIDDITYNDLNMDAVYKSVNHTMTSIGEEYLYALLRTPCTDIAVLEERERVINCMGADEEGRIKLQMALAGMGKLNRISVYSYISDIKNMDSGNKLYHIFCAAALLVSAGLCFVKPAIMVLVTALIIIYNVITYYKNKAEIDPYIQVFAFIARTISQSEDVAKAGIAGIEEYQERLVSCTAGLKKFGKNSWLVSGGNMSGDILDSFMDYIRILFHIDLMKVCDMVNELKKHENELADIYNITGYIDSMVSIASFRAGTGSWCVPVLKYTDSRKNITMEFTDLYHPLIENPVKNSIKTEKSILITGSNASGKSVFIKTVAINAIFAQTIHTVLAESYSSCFFRVYSSMALRDDIFSNESYYIVEIKSLKRILDKAEEQGVPVLCFIDEVLRGTNTLERIASSSQILKQLATLKSLCFAATHDLELAKILVNYFDNYHFEETVKENDVIFDYKLRKGNTKTRNAIKLLNMIGYDKTLTSRAEELAQFFLENGSWREL